ncbi:hypothetical protein [Roseinatronobacter alkalisoli]|uniref:hypothetical protein n=1 Tax=Roseinatronobacter alkalisoli TaxID=3028235 RepID=UPI003B67B7D1
MVIGTANKELDSSSKLGRTRTGAKGIGRFALDRLGARCQLHSSTITERGDPTRREGRQEVRLRVLADHARSSALSRPHHFDRQRHPVR